MEPRVPCPEVFANEPFRHYPPCPSFDTLPTIPAGVVGGTVLAIAAITAVLLLACIVALSLTMGRD